MSNFQENFDIQYGLIQRDEAAVQEVVRGVRSRCHCTCARLKKIATSFVPILIWLPNYHWKEMFVSDVIAGLTVGITVEILI